MEKTIFTFLVISGISLEFLSAQQTAKYTYHDSPIGYLEYLPPDYHTDATNFPLLIYLHGGGESGDGSPESLEKVKSWGPPNLIDHGYDMCFTANGEKQCFIVISPQLTPASTWPYTVYQLMEHIVNGYGNYKVDPDRIYLTGISRGGLGVYQYASSVYNKPSKLAAIAPIAAWSEDAKGCVISERKISVWAFHGKLDTVVPHSMGWAAFSNINQCMNPQPVADLKFTSYDDRYHDSWIPAYDPGSDVQSPNLYEWLLLQERQEADPVTGLTDEAISGFALYPNPARDRISIHFRETPGHHPIVKIYNPEGICVMTDEYDPRREIDVSDLPSGIYVVQATSGSRMLAIQRFIK
ncbi:MAG: T9SS type A sorting domain-containing protein [Cyclobacteriaceae bacterium]